MIGVQEGKIGKARRGKTGRWRNFFKNISFAQIAASGLSAVTVFFLTAKIGLAGSIIGAAVASIISTISSQLYKNVIDESSRRIKGSPDEEEEEEEEEAKRAGNPKRASISADSRTLRTRKSLEQTPHGFSLPSRKIPDYGQSKAVKSVRGAAHGRVVAGSSTTLTRSVQEQPPALKSFSKERRKGKKKVIAVAIASSFVTLAVVCGIILFITDGKGTDVFIREVISKSKSIKNDAKDVTGQLEGKSEAEAPASVESLDSVQKTRFSAYATKKPQPADASKKTAPLPRESVPDLETSETRTAKAKLSQRPKSDGGKNPNAKAPAAPTTPALKGPQAKPEAK